MGATFCDIIDGLYWVYYDKHSLPTTYFLSDCDLTFLIRLTPDSEYHSVLVSTHGCYFLWHHQWVIWSVLRPAQFAHHIFSKWLWPDFFDSFETWFWIPQCTKVKHPWVLLSLTSSMGHMDCTTTTTYFLRKRDLTFFDLSDTWFWMPQCTWKVHRALNAANFSFAIFIIG